jgi:hypothetical protein
VARLFLSRTALEVLDKHQLGTQHLSDLVDKREFAEFVKTTRQAVRDAPEDSHKELAAFEIGYKSYSEACLKKFSPFAVGPPPARWVAKAFPSFVPQTPPKLTLKVLRERPSISDTAIPIALPSRDTFLPLPAKCIDGSPYGFYVGGNVALVPSPLKLSWSEIPSETDTNERFPPPDRSVPDVSVEWGTIALTAILFGSPAFLLSRLVVGRFIALIIGAAVAAYAAKWCKNKFDQRSELKQSSQFTNARRFEDALRAWKWEAKKWYDTDPDWERERADLDIENARIENEVYPAQLKEFEQAEVARRDDYQRSLDEHHAAEVARYKKWQATVRRYVTRESQNRSEWVQGLELTIARFVDQAKWLNLFLEEHPDCHLLYEGVDGERAADRLRANAMKPLKAIDNIIAEWRERGEQEMPPAVAPQPEVAITEAASGSADMSSEKEEALKAMSKEALAKGIFNMECPACKQTIRAFDIVEHFKEQHSNELGEL